MIGQLSAAQTAQRCQRPQPVVLVLLKPPSKRPRGTGLNLVLQEPDTATPSSIGMRRAAAKL